MENIDIRKKAKEDGVHLWEIAERLGMHDSNFSRLLRKELSVDKVSEIEEIIKEIANSRR